MPVLKQTWMENYHKFSCYGFENCLWSYTVKETETVNEFCYIILLPYLQFFFWVDFLLHLDGWKMSLMSWKQTGYFLRSGEDKQYLHITEAVFSSHLVVLIELVAVFWMGSNVLTRTVAQTNLTWLSHCGSEKRGEECNVNSFFLPTAKLMP